jgi:type I restriction enzyme M protein
MDETDLPDEAPEASATEVTEDLIWDYRNERYVKRTPREEVRQRIVRALFHEYGLSVEDMALDFPVAIEEKVRLRRRRADIAIFTHGSEHVLANMRRVVICAPEPRNGVKTVTKLRDYQQAQRDLDVLKQFMAAGPACHYGLWTNGLDLFFLLKEERRFGPQFEERADWPLADETVGTRDVSSPLRLRAAEPEMLKTAFRRCHNFIHGNEGMPKDAAFRQFLYLIFAKMYDESKAHDSRSRGYERRFYTTATEPFDPEGRQRIRERILVLFEEAKEHYRQRSGSRVFRGNEEIELSDRALAFLVSELARYDLDGTDIDAKGAAYQELVGANLRGDRGQYFTPRRAIRLMVRILDPKPGERLLDPACGTGGFLQEALQHQSRAWRDQHDTERREETEQQAAARHDHLQRYADDRLYGADFDPFLVRATSMDLVLNAGTTGNVYHLDSLAFPDGHLDGVAEARQRIPFGSIHVLMTNPPFGSDIPITDETLLRDYRDGVAAGWRRGQNGELVGSNPPASVAPEVLFVQQSVRWLEEGGRLGIVLPDGMLSNPGPSDEGIRRWILRNCWVLASIDLPVEAFIAEANVNILTSLLFLKKKTEDEKRVFDLGGERPYPVFMAVAERVGVDRRGNPVYKRQGDGELVLSDVEEIHRIRISGKEVVRTERMKRPILDDDLVVIAERYREFRTEHPEPGLSRHEVIA